MIFTNFLSTIDNPEHREKTEEVLAWIKKTFPNLKEEVKWNQPMFSDHGTYIIGFSASKKHLAVAPENVAIEKMEDEIKKVGYDYTKEIFRIPWDKEVNYSLLEKIITFNIEDKAACTTFWRK